ncbi:hypothetical protein K505DRAFT_372998 [Melanomma pulvis-pyrius CBS 109.77]|uniref:DUF7730 domain-containing protein n=1 Tax=Melanomma pulvis-pyrius CBS 109.77 TaxID=1314802 RepID=A0A6A6XJU3_9PLEO|nr:hypothetical protein K505DRAFT_372998 [Melanomma pulvis-pyrius CBS 109.77]
MDTISKTKKVRRGYIVEYIESSISRTIPSRSKEARTWRRNQTECLLFRLPAELRMNIYELVMGRHTIYIQHGGYQYHKVLENGKRRLLSYPLHGFHCTRLPLTVNPYVTALNSDEQRANRGQQLLNNICRELYKETAELPYKWNTWSFQSLHVLQDFIVKEKRLPLSHLQAINTIFAQRWWDACVEKLLFSGLKTLFRDRSRVVNKYDVEHDYALIEVHTKPKSQTFWQYYHGNPPYDFL